MRRPAAGAPPGRRLALAAGLVALAALAACGPAPSGPTGPATPRPSAGKPSPGSTGASPTAVPGPTATPPAPPGPGATSTPAPTVVATLAPVTPASPAAVAVLGGRVMAPKALVLAAGGLISDKGLGILSNNSGSIVANNGSNLIANNGSNIIANNGGGLVSKTKYGLRQAEPDVPLQGVAVTLTDAAGGVVVGPDGKPVVAVTDAAGRYAFAGVRPDRHLVVRAELPTVGPLSRIAAPDVADASLDVASTLASTYILDRYVGSQADKVATLARLPADVEAETVLVAGKAAAGQAPPVSLTTSALVAQVDALRAKDATLDAQLEKVKKLLIVAGTSNLGAGEAATSVTLRPFQAIWPMADGSVYLQVPEDGILWRYDVDGKLRAVAGRAAEGPGKDVTVGKAALTVDAKGRLLFGGANGAKLWRVKPGATPADLAVEDLTNGLVDVIAACPLEGDAVLAFTWTPKGPAKAWRLDAGAAPKLLATDQGQYTLGSVKRAVRMPDGGVRLDVAPNMVPLVLRFDVATGATTPVAGWASGMVQFRLGQDGEIYYTNAGSDDVRRLTGAGAADPTAPQLRGPDLAMFSPFALAGDAAYFMGGGFALSTKNATLHKRVAGAETHLAGLKAEATGGAQPGVVALTQPTAFAVEAGGDLLVVDNGQLVRVVPGQAPVAALAAPLTAEGATFKASLPFVAPDGSWILVAIEQDKTAFERRDAIFRVPPGGAPTLLYRCAGTVMDAVPGRDGSLTIADTDPVSSFEFLGKIVRVTPDGLVSELEPLGKPYASAKVWLEGGRFVFAKPILVDGAIKYEPARLEADGTKTPLPVADGPAPFEDARGRTFTFGATIARKDPKTGQSVILAGPGGKVFTGGGVDDGVGTPRAPLFGPEGDLYFLDAANRQIKRIPAAMLE